MANAVCFKVGPSLVPGRRMGKSIRGAHASFQEGIAGEGKSSRPLLLILCLLCTVVPYSEVSAFCPRPSFPSVINSIQLSVPLARTVLFPHQFNGGYDASRAVMWNPMQAAEFVIWHDGNTIDAGKQLMPLIQHWTGTDVGEFMTRLYLGEKDGDGLKLAFESRNVRQPQWKGLDHDGRQALLELLRVALPDEALEPAEIARFAETFLLKEHTWPATIGGDGGNSTTKLEKDSFASLGHTSEIAKMFGELRRERYGDLTADDLLEMVLLPENNVKESAFLQMNDFFLHIGIRLTPSEKIDIVQGMAQGGWGPANIAKFVSHIEELAEEEKSKRMTKSRQKPPSFNPFPPKRKTNIRVTSAEDTSDDQESSENTPLVLPSSFYVGATQEYFAATDSPAQNNNGKTQTDSVRT